jgi:hypothetical protein
MKKSKAEIERDIAAYLAEGEMPRRSEVDGERSQAEAQPGEASPPLVRFKPCFKECTKRRFDEQFDIVPPLAMSRMGYLVGEPWSHRVCHVTSRYSATYPAMVSSGGKYFESCEGITGAEWRALNPFTLQVV